MAEAKLNFNEESLDKKSSLYDLYSRFFQGMTEANKVDAPDYSENPPLNEDGSINNEKIAEGLAEYSQILMKNSAYMMANAIISTVSSGGSGGEGLIFTSSGSAYQRAQTKAWLKPYSNETGCNQAYSESNPIDRHNCTLRSGRSSYWRY